MNRVTLDFKPFSVCYLPEKACVLKRINLPFPGAKTDPNKIKCVILCVTKSGARLHPLHQLQKPAGRGGNPGNQLPVAVLRHLHKAVVVVEKAGFVAVGEHPQHVRKAALEAALCKASPFTTKPARVGKPSPRRSPGQPSSSQREGGYSFLCSPLFAFFMRTVSHTLARQHRRCAALFYSGDSLRFPAYNGNEMPPSIRTPPWYTNHDACRSFFCADFCGGLRARARDDLPAMSRHTTSKAQREKPAFF